MIEAFLIKILCQQGIQYPRDKTKQLGVWSVEKHLFSEGFCSVPIHILSYIHQSNAAPVVKVLCFLLTCHFSLRKSTLTLPTGFGDGDTPTTPQTLSRQNSGAGIGSSNQSMHLTGKGLLVCFDGSYFIYLGMFL